MIDSLLNPIVSALLSTLLAPTDTAAHQEQMTREMVIKVRNMPTYMSFGVVGLTLAFDANAVARTGKHFYDLAPDARAAHIARWRGSRISLRRDLVDVYEKMGTFIYYSLLEAAEGHA